VSINLYQSSAPNIRQVAEIIVRGSRPERRGTGYMFSPSIILTAAHVVSAGERVRVRFEARTEAEWSAEVSGLWSDVELDVAILFIEPKHSVAYRPVRFGRIGDGSARLSYRAVGFPLFKVRRDDGTYRDTAEAAGEIAPLSNHKEGTLELAVRAPGPDLYGSSSPWEGMSGAAVFCFGRVVGLITEHHLTDGLGRLTANRVDRWFGSAAITDIRRILGEASVPSTAEEWPDVTQPRWIHDLGHSVGAWAQAEMLANDVQPYRLIDAGVPTVSNSYVERWGVTDAGDRTSVDDLLSRSRHVLVEAPAGVGKSVLTYRLAHKTAALLLDSMMGSGLPADVDYIAVRVPARDLVSGLSLPEAIAHSVRHRLGEFLTASIPASQFGATTPGGRPWLVMVDGLDEIIDKAQWRKVVTVIVTDIMRPESPYRWLVTTRPVIGGNLDALRKVSGVTRLVLEVFDDSQLREMATCWLKDFGEGDTDANVDEFLNQASGSLQELIRVPLLAAVALLLYRTSAEHGLPTTRPGLYQQMITYFLNGRGDGSERQRWFVRLIGDAGGPPELARWLYSRRSEILHELSAQTLEQGSPTVVRAASWIERSADHVPDFLYDWNAIVSSMLTSTGLLALGSAGTLLWLHQTVPEYLVARRRAESISGTWPPRDLEKDELLGEAMAGGTLGEQAVFTIACRLVSDQLATRRVYEHLMKRSGDYDYLLKYHDAETIIGQDTDNIDHYILLAAKLLANGITFDASFSGRVVQRLLYRARSIFHPEVYCSLVAMQPGRLLAKKVLDGMISSRELPIAARAGALAAIARVYGITAAAAAVIPLLEFSGPANYIKQRDGDLFVGGLPDGRLSVAIELAQLGEPAREIVARILDVVEVAAGDMLGCQIAAEAASLVNDDARIKYFVLLCHPNDGGQLPLVFAPLLIRIGRRAAAVALVAEIDSRNSLSGASEAARALLELGEAELAADVARADIRRSSRAWRSYEILASAGHADEVARSLSYANDQRRRLSTDDWTEIAQALRRTGHSAAIGGPLRELLNRGSSTAKLAILLIELGDGRGQAMLRAIAADTDAALSERYEAARRLLATADHQEGADVLLEIARGTPEPQSVRRPDDMMRVARSLVLLGETTAAIDLLRRLVAAEKGGNSQSLELLCHLSPPDGIGEIDRRLQRGGLEKDDIVKLMIAKATALKAGSVTGQT
jgi:hypothetical protein